MIAKVPMEFNLDLIFQTIRDLGVGDTPLKDLSKEDLEKILTTGYFTAKPRRSLQWSEDQAKRKKENAAISNGKGIRKKKSKKTPGNGMDTQGTLWDSKRAGAMGPGLEDPEDMVWNQDEDPGE